MAVEFNEPSAGGIRREKRPSFFSRLIIATGLVRTEGGAQAVMLILAVLIAAAAGFFLLNGRGTPPPPTPEETRLNV